MANIPYTGYTNLRYAAFEWDERKDALNQVKHGVSFSAAQSASSDPRCVIAEDTRHSRGEKRYFCFGLVDGGVLTARFTYRNDAIRIFGAGYWRKGRAIYEKTNQIHR
ncbi:MAG: BrnT family toxin [Elusimicrobia bacterium]|nr:BrnT family toxin [Elusimicrobiota bacterium]